MVPIVDNYYNNYRNYHFWSLYLLFIFMPVKESALFELVEGY